MGRATCLVIHRSIQREAIVIKNVLMLQNIKIHFQNYDNRKKQITHKNHLKRIWITIQLNKSLATCLYDCRGDGVLAIDTKQRVPLSQHDTN